MSNLAGERVNVYPGSPSIADRLPDLIEIQKQSFKWFLGEGLKEELESFSAALKRSPEIEKFFLNPVFANEEKGKFLKKIYPGRIHANFEILFNFLMVLLEKKRFHLIHEILQEFKRIVDEKRGMGTAEIKTAVPLEPHREREMVSQLEKIAGYKIRVKKEVDPALVGGVVVKIRNKILDGSVKHRIDLLKKELTRIRTV